ncbi:transposable element Tcb2 transposase [Trichonephila clavipes]|nr:transposable element Tcb2 transposase [Trichonephila clavipes]
MMEAKWSARQVYRQLGRSDCVVRRYWDQWIREMSFHEDQTNDALDRPVVEKTTTSDESRFNLSSDDNRVREWRPRGERLNPAFALQQHTTPTAGVMVLGAIAYSTWSPLVFNRGTFTFQRYVHDIQQPHVLPLMQRLPGALFQQDNAQPHMASVSPDCLRTVSTLP